MCITGYWMLTDWLWSVHYRLYSVQRLSTNSDPQGAVLANHQTPPSSLDIQTQLPVTKHQESIPDFTIATLMFFCTIYSYIGTSYENMRNVKIWTVAFYALQLFCQPLRLQQICTGHELFYFSLKRLLRTHFAPNNCFFFGAQTHAGPHAAR